MRVNVTLACTDCGDRNYITTKNKRTNPERIEMKKFCARENKHYTAKQNNCFNLGLGHYVLAIFYTHISKNCA
ncbi:50S ribosomal protein L33 [Staphylococcus pseudintermedius]|nr:50S ribosomal protein L33 [Staphylococcus pseudintermedius]